MLTNNFININRNTAVGFIDGIQSRGIFGFEPRHLLIFEKKRR